ncbi:hypothetical protein IBX65_08475 [Candidatus Aerophobetes bacterium]|nr:hypothetical protein [Candidatus Aerophobetes bacterium]
MKIALWIIGVLVAVVVIYLIASSIGSMMFERKVKGEVEKLFAGIDKDKAEIITPEDLAGLPAPLQKWLQNSQVIGKERITFVWLKQEGFFRTKEGGSWMPFTATQYYRIDTPGFIWHVTMKPFPFFAIKGRDSYYEGRGNMLIKLFSLIKVADATGPEMDQGTLVRYLNEIMWFPTAALCDYIEWEALDETSARATMSYRGVSASAVFYFNENGDLLTFIAERYMDAGGEFTKETWSTPIRAYGEFHGIRIPTEGEGVWKLDSGDFSYIRLKIVDIDYNTAAM